MILYARQQKRHRCKEQTFELWGRRWGWDDLREYHWNVYITIYKINDQCKFDAWSRALKASAVGQPRGMWLEGRWKRGSEWGIVVHPWLIHVNAWKKTLQYCKVITSCSAGDSGSIPGLGRSSGKGNGNPLQYSCLENPMDRGAWRATVHRVAKSRICVPSKVNKQFQEIVQVHCFGYIFYKSQICNFETQKSLSFSGVP